MRNRLSPEELERLIQFAEDDRKPIEPELVAKLYELHAAVQRNALKHLVGANKRNAMLSERFERQRAEKRAQIQLHQFGETGLDSLEVAKALLYNLQQLKAYKLNKSKVIQILFEMYASWLGSKGERLFTETPVATAYGPQFWRVYKHLSTDTTETYDSVKALAEKNPGVAAFVRNAANKYYDYGENELNNMFKKSVPYKNASSEKHGGKWNTPINDADIYAWKTNNK